MNQSVDLMNMMNFDQTFDHGNRMYFRQFHYGLNPGLSRDATAATGLEN